MPHAPASPSAVRPASLASALESVAIESDTAASTSWKPPLEAPELEPEPPPELVPESAAEPAPELEPEPPPELAPVPPSVPPSAARCCESVVVDEQATTSHTNPNEDESKGSFTKGPKADLVPLAIGENPVGIAGDDCAILCQFGEKRRPPAPASRNSVLLFRQQIAEREFGFGFELLAILLVRAALELLAQRLDRQLDFTPPRVHLDDFRLELLADVESLA